MKKTIEKKLFKQLVNNILAHDCGGSAFNAGKDIGAITPPHAEPWVLKYGNYRIAHKGPRFAVVEWGKLPTVEELAPVYPELHIQYQAYRVLSGAWWHEQTKGQAAQLALEKHGPRCARYVRGSYDDYFAHPFIHDESNALAFDLLGDAIKLDYPQPCEALEEILETLKATGFVLDREGTQAVTYKHPAPIGPFNFLCEVDRARPHIRRFVLQDAECRESIVQMWFYESSIKFDNNRLQRHKGTATLGTTLQVQAEAVKMALKFADCRW